MKTILYYQFTDDDYTVVSEFLRDTARMDSLIEEYVEASGLDRDQFWKPYNKVAHPNSVFTADDFRTMRAGFINAIRFAEDKYRGTLATLKETMPDHYAAVRQQIASFVDSLAALTSRFRGVEV